jgi:hypothetical protein
VPHFSERRRNMNDPRMINGLWELVKVIRNLTLEIASLRRDLEKVAKGVSDER